jgi:sugar phosphate isomerase/epimerase
MKNNFKIGVSTKAETNNENFKRIKDLADFGFKFIELNNKITRIRWRDVERFVELKKAKGLDFSIHSLTNSLFCDDKIISDSDLGFLKGEIHLAALIGASNVIFHISKQGKLNRGEEKALSLLALFASKNKVKLCLETNNFLKSYLDIDYFSGLINKTKNLYFCLDIGHLNIAIEKDIIDNPAKFIESLKKKTAQLHLSYNNGLNDQHVAPNKKGQKYFQDILKYFEGREIPLVIEIKSLKGVLKTRDILENGEFDNNLISEKELLSSIKQARKEYNNGKTARA